MSISEERGDNLVEQEAFKEDPYHEAPEEITTADEFMPEGYDTSGKRRQGREEGGGSSADHPNRKPVYIAAIVFLVLVLFIMSLVFLGRKVSRENPGLTQVIMDTQMGLSDYEYVNNYPDKAIIESDNSPSIGSNDPLLVIVEFGDFACPMCREIYTMMGQARVRYADKIKIIWRDFPVTSDLMSKYLAEAGRCADEQGKFWVVHDQFFSRQDILDRDAVYEIAAGSGLDLEIFKSCIESGKYSSMVMEDMRAGYETLGVKGTPTLFINGTKIEGAFPADKFMQFLDEYFSLYEELLKKNK